jgi:hypothetical protein
VKKRYYYSIMRLKDALPSHEVMVPNCTADEALEIFRYLSGHRKDFPEYNDHSIRIVGIDEEAWGPPKMYREAYAPPDIVCIARHSNQGLPNLQRERPRRLRG